MKPVVVEANANLRIATPHAKTRFVELTGVFACDAAAVQPYVERLPNRVKVLDRTPTEAELAEAVARGVLPSPTADPGDKDPGDGEEGGAETGNVVTPPPARAFTAILKDDLVPLAAALALDTAGTREELYARVAAYAELQNVSLEGSVDEVVGRLTPA